MSSSPAAPRSPVLLQLRAPEPPVPQIASPYATGGRGLLLVSAVADAWTACPKQDGIGKRVIAFVKRPEISIAP